MSTTDAQLERGPSSSDFSAVPARRVRVIAWLNLIANITIIGTGGAVRLTGSGLGCPTWPQCTEDSWIPTAELSWHSLIEFGNRMMSPVLGILAVLALIVVWRYRQQRRDLWVHAFILFAGILVQAFVGGITVWTGLNAWIVGTHYVASAILVGVSTSFVLRAGRGTAPREKVLPGWMFGLTHLATVLLAAVVLVGVVTTGNGPHSGDAGVERDQAAWDTLAHLHAWVGYALGAALVVLLIGAIATRQRRYLGALLAVIAVAAVQIVVGIIQARLGLPPLLVGIHMVLAAITVAITVTLVDSTRAAVTQ